MENSSNSGFFCRGVLTAAASVEAVLENNNTLGFTITPICWRSCACVHGKCHLCQHGSCHRTHTGKTTVKKCPLKQDFSHFGSVIWGNVLEICILSPFCFLSNDFVKLLNFTIMFIGLALQNYEIMDYLKFPILFIWVCF